MAEALLNIEGVEVRRGMGVVLSAFDLTLASGEILVLHGANGAGKSTVIETAAGLLPLEQGSVAHHQKMTSHADGRRIKPTSPFGLTLQTNGVIGSERVHSHLTAVAELSDASLELNPLLEAYGLQHRAHDRVAHLSGGQARKVAVLAGLMPAMLATSPCLVLLDEPDSGLDEAAIDSLCEHVTTLAAAGHGFLIATHNPRLLSIATHLHDLNTKTKHNSVSDEPWVPLGTPAPSKWLLVRTGHRYSRSTSAGFARNGLAALMVLGCVLALGDPSVLPKGLWVTGGVLAPAFAAGLAGDPTTHLMREGRANDWWRAQAQRTPNALGLGLGIGAWTTALSSVLFLGGLDLCLIAAGAVIGELTMASVRALYNSTHRLSRPNAVFIRLLLPAFILPWALIVSWVSNW
ncbi:MAG: ATP-binding cassette domain-containing protein [Candidatus Poseidoniaceae archaeon]|nr:ATP-binding cassette domain-containing protein [Candidatus Poseidoniaceae archaeon]